MVDLNLQKYPVYKSSGVEWLVDIPEHWEVVPLTKNISSLADYRGKTPEKTADGIFLVTTRNIRNGKINYEISKEYVSDEKYLEIMRRGLPKIGDILLTMEAPLGEVANVDFETIALAQRIIKIRTSEQVLNPWFAKYLIMSSFFQNQIQKEATGSTAQGIKASKLHKLTVLKPTLSEQQAIANFLDDKLAQIDEHIAKKQRMIELLKEQKTVIINQAVTKGINPDVPMKYSGVEWLGEIPEHWEVKRLKYVFHIQTGVTLGKSYINQVLETRPYLRVANVQDGYIDISDIKTIELPNNEISRYVLQKGDVLMTEGGDFDKLGRGYIWKGQIKGCLHQNHIFAVRPIYKYLNSNFIAAFISSQKCKNYFIFTAKQTTNLASTNSTHLKNLKLLLPPLNEQQEIVSFIEKKSEKIGRSLTVIEKEIKLIQEYRTTLISETVTGKIDVRKYHPPQ
jgi:type I restriction enzyme S subunit